jgi:hypothetical protein
MRKAQIVNLSPCSCILHSVPTYFVCLLWRGGKRGEGRGGTGEGRGKRGQGPGEGRGTCRLHVVIWDGDGNIATVPAAVLLMWAPGFLTALAVMLVVAADTPLVMPLRQRCPVLSGIGHATSNRM